MLRTRASVPACLRARFLLLAASLFVTVLVAGCGGGDDSSDSAAPAAANPSVETDEPAAVPAEVARAAEIADCFHQAGYDATPSEGAALEFPSAPLQAQLRESNPAAVHVAAAVDTDDVYEQEAPEFYVFIAKSEEEAFALDQALDEAEGAFVTDVERDTPVGEESAQSDPSARTEGKLVFFKLDLGISDRQEETLSSCGLEAFVL